MRDRPSPTLMSAAAVGPRQQTSLSRCPSSSQLYLYDARPEIVLLRLLPGKVIEEQITEECLPKVQTA